MLKHVKYHLKTDHKNLELKVRTFVQKCPFCQLTLCNESDQTVSQSTKIYNGSVVSLPSHMCGLCWPTFERWGRIPDTGIDMCILALDRTFSTATLGN